MLSPGFAEAMATCFQKLANDPQKMEEEIEFFIDVLMGKDIVVSLIPEFLAGGAILKLFKLIKPAKQAITKALQKRKAVNQVPPPAATPARPSSFGEIESDKDGPHLGHYGQGFRSSCRCLFGQFYRQRKF